jgi:hypothetical protein
VSKVRLLLVAIVAMSSLVVLAGPAVASVPAAPSAKFCSAYSKIGNGSSSSQSLQQQAGSVKQFQAAAKLAPGKIKTAGNQIASVLSKVAKIKPSNVADLANLYKTSDYKAYGKAIVTFFTYGASCATK